MSQSYVRINGLSRLVPVRLSTEEIRSLFVSNRYKS